MAIEFEGKSIETSPNGFLINSEDWTEALATHLASSEGLEPVSYTHLTLPTKP